MLVALSNKDFVGETLDVPLEERLTGTLAATAVSAWLGARVFRAHDVAATRQTLDMVASIRGDRPADPDGPRPRLSRAALECRCTSPMPRCSAALQHTAVLPVRESGRRAKALAPPGRA